MELSDLYNKKFSELSDVELNSVHHDFDKVADESSVDEFVEFGEKVKDSVLFQSLHAEDDKIRDRLYELREFKRMIEFTEMYSLIGKFYKYCPISSFNEESDDYEFLYVCIQCFRLDMN